MPAFFWYDQAAKDKKTRMIPAKFCRCSAFVNEHEMHELMTPENANQSQSDKFKKTAKNLGVDLDEDRLKDALRKIAKPEAQHASDCAVHNGPAYPAGPCDCGRS